MRLHFHLPAPFLRQTLDADTTLWSLPAVTGPSPLVLRHCACAALPRSQQDWINQVMAPGFLPNLVLLSRQVTQTQNGWPLMVVVAVVTKPATEPGPPGQTGLAVEEERLVFFYQLVGTTASVMLQVRDRRQYLAHAELLQSTLLHPQVQWPDSPPALLSELWQEPDNDVNTTTQRRVVVPIQEVPTHPPFEW
jgi:hypothetical protein